MKKILALIFLCLLSSCGGGGGGGGAPAGGAPSASNFSGVAVDGYLYKARAFLDLNGNGQYDNGEPTATTDANGGFTLSATQDQINSHSVVVSAIAGTTIDQDYPNTPMSSGMTLVAPAGNPSVVSPLTTQVSAKMAAGLSLADAKSAVQTELGLPNIDVMKNFVAEKAINAAYADAHKVAVSVAEVLKNIETQSSANTTLANRFSSLTTTVTSQVAPNVTQIKAAASVDAAKTVMTSVISQVVNIYNIGGSISGLTANGLVLANGLGTVSPSSGANSFTFSSQKSSGAAYAVTVQSNPTGQICTVLNGSGAVGIQSITNVSVSCSNTPGALGGTISGLTTSGLVLKNGSDELTVTSGSSTFRFSSTVADGAAYSVSVKTQPTGKTCSVSSGTGTMVSAGVTNVQIACSTNSYSVSGSISGLVTSGLKIKNGSEVLTVNSGATTFVFSNSVAHGGSYAVVIENQPAGYTCSASNESGVMGAQNITSIQISCSLLSYSLSGNITGLASGGLSISNGGETIFINSNATSFSFVNKVANGGSYAVSIATQASSGYSCNVNNGNGTMTEAGAPALSITCTNLYPLKGAISGFADGTSNLVLSTGIEDISIAPNAIQYQFAALYQYASAYSLEVKTQPNGYYCTFNQSTFTNYSGFMAGNSNDILTRITCKKVYSVGGSITGTIPAGVTVNFVQDGGSLSETLSIPAGASSFAFNKKVLANVAFLTSVGSPDGYVCKLNQRSFSINNSAPADINNLILSCQQGYEIILNDLYSTGSIGYGIRLNGQLNFAYLSPDFAQSLVLSTNIGGVVNSIDLTSAAFKSTRVGYNCTASMSGCNNTTSLGVFASGTAYSFSSSHGSCMLAKVATPDTRPTNTQNTTLSGTVSAKVYFDVLCISG